VSSPDLHVPGIRFGEFTADLESRELYRDGTRVKLQGQPFEVLALLLKRQGRIVTREEFRRQLWPSDTFVDFEHGLNAAVNRLREALGDSADTPRFIETLPRRGYRFVALVNGVVSNGDESFSTDLPRVTVAHEPIKRSFRLYFSAVVLLCVLAIALVWWLPTNRGPRITGSRRLTFTGQVEGPRYPFGWAETFPSLATDNGRVYYSSLEQLGDRLTYVGLSGGDQVVMPVPLSAHLRHISPDGSTLLVSGVHASETEEHLWFVPTAGGGPKRIGGIDGHDGAWSADGRRIAFANKLELFVADSDGGYSRKIATLTGKAFWLRWSPDSSLIRFTFVDQKSGKSTLWECRPDGTELHALSLSREPKAEECCGEWTGDGRYYLYRVFQNAHADIWALRQTGLTLSGHRPVRLTTGPLDTMDAIPSANGRQLLALEAQENNELHRFDLNTHQLAPFLAGLSPTETRAIPGTDHLAYIESRGKITKLWRMRPDGTERLQLTAPPLLVLRIAPSPDGKQIALMAKMPDEPWGIFVIPATGGPMSRVSPKNESVADPTWSPDGRSILFGGVPYWWPGGEKPTPISSVNLGTGQITPVPRSEGLFSPRWSPDGRYIVAMSTSFDKLMLFDFATSRWSELANGNFDFPEWYPDSEYIYVTVHLKKQNQLMRVRRANGKREEVLDLMSVNPKAQVCWMITPPDKDSLLVSCSVPSGDIYALDMELP
jgi:DNA-binding winged helix-turn-helix (wHTH) protein/Tol biopolymer transport system component